MVRRRNKWCAGILVFVIFVTGIFPVTVNAMTEKNIVARAALLKHLQGEVRDEYFFYSGTYSQVPYAFIDFDNDKVDELIVNVGAGYCSQIIYDYHNGKVYEACGISQGDFTSYYKKAKVIYCDGSGHMGTYYRAYWKWKNGIYEKVAERCEQTETVNKKGEPVLLKKPIYTYYIKEKGSSEAGVARWAARPDKKVSKKTYQKYVKKLKKDDKPIKFSAIKWKYYG